MESPVLTDMPTARPTSGQVLRSVGPVTATSNPSVARPQRSFTPVMHDEGRSTGELATTTTTSTTTAITAAVPVSTIPTLLLEEHDILSSSTTDDAAEAPPGLHLPLPMRDPNIQRQASSSSSSSGPMAGSANGASSRVWHPDMAHLLTFAHRMPESGWSSPELAVRTVSVGCLEQLHS